MINLKQKAVLIVSSIVLLALIFNACEPLATLPDSTKDKDSLTPSVTELSETVVSEEENSVVSVETAVPATLTPEPEKAKIWFQSHLPEDYRQLFLELDAIKEFDLVDRQDDADIVLDFNVSEEINQYVFALVAPFRTLTDEVTFEAFRAFWNGSTEFPTQKLVLTAETHYAMSLILGEPKAELVNVLGGDDFDDYFEEGESWGIVPFDSLQSQWKVIAINEQSPVRKAFDADEYPLKISIGLDYALPSDTHAEELKEQFELLKQELMVALPRSNRDGSKLTTVIMTGVTAMVRATAKEMEYKGVLHPGGDVREVMREADIAHVSNEIPFYSSCPEPQWTQENLKFCSNPKYMELLLDIGTDVVDLTGDHFADYGADAMFETLDLYDENSLPYFGGGRDITEATQAVKFEINGNKIAFLGCNGKEPGYARVSETEPGAYRCDMDFMVSKVQELVAEGYLPVFTFQHFEYYHWGIEKALEQDFRRIAEAGAVVVSGSQGHQPHAFEFYEGGFLHYGLGNLFFDQLTIYPDTDKAFLDRFVFYDGTIISIELLTVRFRDWSKPSWATETEREEMLRKLFEVSNRNQ